MTQAVSLFELATELLRVHERSAPGRVTVVPVLVDNLDAALPVLEALCALTDGRLLHTRADELQAPVPVTPDVVRLAAVEGALTTIPSGGTRRITLVTLPLDLADATFADPPIGAVPSPGERTVLAFARATIHRDLDNHEFAVIAYYDFAIDLPFRRAVWSLVVDQLADMPHATLRTLVVVAESSVDVALHCQTNRGFRFAVNDGRLLRRRGGDDLNVIAMQMAQYSEPFVLFLGAGFSRSSRMPLGNAMRDSAVRRLLNIAPSEHQTSEELAYRFHGWIAPRDGWLTTAEQSMREDEYVRQLTLEQVIRAEKRLYPNLPTLEEFRAHHDAVIGAPGPAAVDLSFILSKTVGRAILVEVNFDRLVEVHSPVPIRSFVSDAEFEAAPDYLRSYLAGTETEVPLLKVHGDIEDSDSCVVSDEQTERGIGTGKLQSLRALLSIPPRLWIYVGVSMRDRDLLPVFAGEDFATGLDERWVSPYLPDTVEAFARARIPFWRDTRLPGIEDRLVAETADAFFAAWRAALSP